MVPCAYVCDSATFEHLNLPVLFLLNLTARPKMPPPPAGFSKTQECDNLYLVFKEPEVGSSEQ